MTPRPPTESICRDAARQVAATALGHTHRDDPSLPRTGGPAGNAQLTAWLGLLLLPLFVAELITLLSLNGLLSWHIAIGVILIPPALLKTTTTSWRILRYYTGTPVYRQAGPPPLVLRILGPLVVLSTLALLGTGVALLLIGPTAASTSLITVAGQRITVLTLHQASTIAWAVATGLHVLGRVVPALQLTMTLGQDDKPAGGWLRTCVFLTTLALGAAGAVLASSTDHWTSSGLHRDHPGDRPPFAAHAHTLTPTPLP
jgi:hypothetical protein